MARGIAVRTLVGAMLVAARADDMLSEQTQATTVVPTQAEEMKKGADADNRTRPTPTATPFAWWLGRSR